MTELMEATLLAEARNGNDNARETIIGRYRSVIAKLASETCHRKLDWHNDDELSIALIAFNEAINSYNDTKGMSFHNYARMVIRRRLVDYFRRESKNQHLPLEVTGDEGDTFVPFEIEQSWAQYNEKDRETEQEEEILSYTEELQAYGITMMDLVHCSPKHRDTRLSLLKVARLLIQHPPFLKHLQHYQQLPVKELVLVSGVSRKVIETGRKYIIAVTLVLLNPEYEHMRSFIIFPDEKGGP